ncbi:MAG: hypothetical protein KAS32_30130 [Candidatus Peribacteraceae bacterium]|nr:hypothetical protein [Candidatus Peribacteraceae bacterium]
MFPKTVVALVVLMLLATSALASKEDVLGEENPKTLNEYATSAAANTFIAWECFKQSIANGKYSYIRTDHIVRIQEEHSSGVMIELISGTELYCPFGK